MPLPLRQVTVSARRACTRMRVTTYQEVLEVGHGLLEAGAKHGQLPVVAAVARRTAVARQLRSASSALLRQALQRVEVEPLLDGRELGAAGLVVDRAQRAARYS